LRTLRGRPMHGVGDVVSAVRRTTPRSGPSRPAGPARETPPPRAILHYMMGTIAPIYPHG
jgi:hypothetical protein